MNERSYTSTPLLWPHDVDREKFYIFRRTANSIEGSMADRIPKHKVFTNSVSEKNIPVNAVVKARHLTLYWARVGKVYLSLISLIVLTTILWTMAFYGKWNRAVTLQRNLPLALGGKMMGAAITFLNLLCFYQNVRCHDSEKTIFIHTDVFFSNWSFLPFQCNISIQTSHVHTTEQLWLVSSISSLH